MQTEESGRLLYELNRLIYEIGRLLYELGEDMRKICGGGGYIIYSVHPWRVQLFNLRGTMYPSHSRSDAPACM